MISKRQKATIQRYLSKHYSPKVIAALKKKKIFNSEGNEFSSASIQKIVNGVQSNSAVEKQIAILVDKARLEQEITKKMFKA